MDLLPSFFGFGRGPSEDSYTTPGIMELLLNCFLGPSEVFETELRFYRF